MATIAERGKQVDNALQGTVRIERDNDRIVYTINGEIVRIDFATHTSFYDGPTGNELMRMGQLLDGKYGISWFDPTDGRELMRNGIMPDDTAASLTPRDEYSVAEVYE